MPSLTHITGLVVMATVLVGPHHPGVATVLVLTVAAVALLTGVPVLPVPPRVRPGGICRSPRHLTLLRQCDPDAAGRPRPRAPSCS
jgi:hypothetical protein